MYTSYVKSRKKVENLLRMGRFIWAKKISVAIQATAHSLLHKQHIVFNDVLKRKDNKQQK